MTTPNLPNPLETQDSTARQGWTMLLDALPQGVILVDSEGRSLEVNSSAARILHRDRETLLSCSLPDLWSNSSAVDGSAIAVEDLPCVAALRIGTPVHRKTIGWNWEDGSILWLDVAAEPLPGGGALVTFDDTTEHRLQSRKLDRITELYSALSQVNQAIVLSPTKEALLDKICEVMVEFGKFTMAWIGWNDPETHEVRGVSKYGDENGYLDSLQVRSDDTPLGQGGTGTAIREEHTCVVNDFLGSPETSPWLDAASRSGFAASASVPIRKDGKVCGALMVYATEKNYFGSQEIKLLEEAAEDVTFALDNLELAAQRKQTEEALKESEYFFRESQRAAGIGSYKTDFIEGKWESSEVLDNIFGIDRDYRRSIRGWLGIIHPDDQAMMDQYLREEVIAGRKPFSKEYRIIRKSDASTRWMFGHGEVIFDADGNVVSLIGTIQDITERKAAEESLRSSEAKLNLALSSAEMGVWTWDIQKNLRQFDDRVCQLLGIDKDTFAGSEEEFLQVVKVDPLIKTKSPGV